MKYEFDVGDMVVVLTDKIISSEDRREFFEEHKGPWTVHTQNEDESGLYYVLRYPDCPYSEWVEPHEIYRAIPKTVEELL